MTGVKRPTARRTAKATRQNKSTPAKAAPQLQEDLAVELYTLVRLALGELGVAADQQQRALDRSRLLPAAPRISGPLLRDSRGLSALLLEWSREAPYIDADGNPRVLPIEGPGVTFETLALRFLPKTPLSRALDMAYAAAEVSRRPGRKIALIGGIMVSVVRAADSLYLAHAIRQVDQLLQTVLHNRRVNRKPIDDGRMERMVIGVIARAEFKSFMRELRPQIYDLLQRVDSSVQHRQPKTARELKSATAVSVGVYVSQEDDWERAGIDASAVVRPIGKSK